MKNLMSRAKEILVVMIGLIFMTTIGACKKSLRLDEPSTDPLSVFDAVWNVMDTRYALFDIKGVNWADAKIQYRQKLNAGSTDEELFHVLEDMLLSLHDGHVALVTPADTAVYTGFYSQYPVNFDVNVVLHNYLQDDFQKIGPVIYAIRNNVGYIYYADFRQDITDEQVNALFKLMEQTTGLIIDVRSNSGGNTKNAERIVSHFAPSKILVKYELVKRGPAHDDFFDPVAYYVSPAATIYYKRTAVLTNRSCFSACNDFVLYMSQLSNVQKFGDQTGGGGGLPANYLLPNGWKLQYTSTATLSPSSAPVENGIAPNYPITITSQDQIAGKDPILEQAFIYVQQ